MKHPVDSKPEAPGLNQESLRLQGRREQWKLLSLSTPAVLAVIAIIVIPVGWLFYLSFVDSDGQFSLQHYQKMIEYKSYARVFITTFEVSLLTTLICILKSIVWGQGGVRPNNSLRPPGDVFSEQEAACINGLELDGFAEVRDGAVLLP